MNWDVLNRLIGVHTVAYRLTGGLVGHNIPGVPPMLLLDHVGAKSGRRRTSPLVYLEDGDNIALVASKGGHPRHPAWYHNLRANPRTKILFDGARSEMVARELDGEERERWDERGIEIYPGWVQYRKRAPRTIPVIELSLPA